MLKTITVGFMACMLGITSWAPKSFGIPDAGDALVGTWSGKATGPDGGPPTGDITLVFEKGSDGELTGKITVMAPGGGFQYTGNIDNVKLEQGNLSARVIFAMGENPIEVNIRGPIENQSIRGKFTVLSQGQPLGEGSFHVSKQQG